MKITVLKAAVERGIRPLQRHHSSRRGVNQRGGRDITPNYSHGQHASELRPVLRSFLIERRRSVANVMAWANGNRDIHGGRQIRRKHFASWLENLSDASVQFSINGSWVEYEDSE